MVEWSTILGEVREARSDFVQTEGMENESLLLERLRPMLPQLKEQLFSYHNELSASQGEQKSAKLRSKEFILGTRAALRFGMCCMTFEGDRIRRTLQNYAVLKCQIHVCLSAILSLKGGDSKCRILSAQFLSNLVTSNYESAKEVSISLPVSPSEEWISSNIRENVFDMNKEELPKFIEGPNWVDAFLSSVKSGDRNGSAAVVAALHNCIVSLEEGKDDSFVKKVASDPLLVSSLLRNFVSANKASNQDDYDNWDEATEWIFILIARLMSFGLFSLMYTGISRSNLTEIQNVLPEQNILLNCMIKQVEDHKESLQYTDETYEFLAMLLCRLYELSESNDSIDIDEDEKPDLLLLQAAVCSILDVLSIALGFDNPQSQNLRQHFGLTTNILQQSAQVLGKLVDDLTLKNLGVKAREMKISNEEQSLITVLVQFLGNLCYKCRHNQDLMRTTLVQPRLDKATEGANERNALHVLLSCTTFSTCCFTLREWSVIAIRNVLENNAENQHVVADLDAQSAVQSAALQSAGVQVQLDQHGKVSLSTLKEDDNNNQ